MKRSLPHCVLKQHQDFMRLAYDYGRRVKGKTGKNPAVGCIIVKNNVIVAAAHTQVTGTPHAEIVALQKAGIKARGATVYVSLEPCSHKKTGINCSDALIKAQVETVVCGSKDPNPMINGLSYMQLRQAGINVVEDIDICTAEKDLSGFFKRMRYQKPWVILKIALSKNDKIAVIGQRTAISNDMASQRVHLLRAKSDAIMIGSQTMHIDNPQLTCRVRGLEEFSPARYVIDNRLSVTKQSHLVKTAHNVPLTIFTRQESWLQKKDFYSQDIFSAVNFVVLPTENDKTRISIHSIMDYFNEMNINTLMIEGGQTMNTMVFDTQIVDEVHLIRAPFLIKEKGLNVLAKKNIDDTLKRHGFSCTTQEELSDNIYEVYCKK